MATVLSTLYPPLVDTFMPAFPKTEKAVINFSISPYNSRAAITKLHVSVVDQRTNLSVLKSSGFLTNDDNVIDGYSSYFINGIWIIDVSNSNNVQINSNNTCQLTIPAEALKDKEFVVSNYYKVQLRFSNDSESLGPNTKLDNTYLTKNRSFFSEWSSICLIKAIPSISLQIAGYEPSNQIKKLEETTRTYPKEFPAGIIPIAGNVQFEYGESTENEELINYQVSTKDRETLRSYQITVQDEYDTVVLETDTIYTYGNEDPNRIYYLIDLTDSQPNSLYSITINCVTKNQYEFSFTYYIKISQYVALDFNPVWTFGTKIYKDLETCIVKFFIDNGIEKEQEVIAGEFISNIDIPEKTGWDFVNWYSDKECTEIFDFAHTKIIEDIAVYAGWKEIGTESSPIATNTSDFTPSDEKHFISQKVCIHPDFQEDGQLKITISSTISNTSHDPLDAGFLYIKRATSLDNFKHWEILKCTYFPATNSLEDTIIDTTLGSLVRYKYSCQYQLTNGRWSATHISPEIVYPDFHDILLSREDKQLAIRYNGQITSMTPTVNRIKIDTLGGKYPKFAENAQMNYKQFQLTGMIIAESDYNRKFLNDLDYKEEMAIYDKQENGTYLLRNDTLPDSWSNDSFSKNRYGIYSSDISVAIDPQITSTKEQEKKYASSGLRPIIGTTLADNPQRIMTDMYPTNNWWWERLFREEAIKWLNDGEPKLFRSMTEGNMVVMLTDISLTPNTQVGRRTYNFSATAYEIADGYSLDVLSDLGIWNLQNDFNTITEEEKEAQSITKKDTISQILSVSGKDTIGETENLGIKKIIEDYYNSIYHSGSFKEFYVDSSSYILKNFRIQFESKPRWYKIYNNEISKLADEEVINETDKDQYALGYLLQLQIEKTNWVNIFVNEKGYYQAPSNINVLNAYIQPEDIATIDYILYYNLKHDDSETADIVETIETLVGQLSGLWYPGPDFKLKEYLDTKYTYIQRVKETDSDQGNNGIRIAQIFDSWEGIGFDILPYTMVSIKFTDENDYIDYLIGRSGIYDLMQNVSIEDAYIKGRRMFKVTNTGMVENTSQQYYPDEWEFVLENNPLNGEPEYNHVYPIGNNKYQIYYINDQWYDFDFDEEGVDDIGLAKVPISGMINYRGTIIKNTYYN